MLYPIYFDLKNKTAMVIGGGPVALRKIKGLAAAKARIICVAPKILEEIRKIKNIEVCDETFTLQHLKKYDPIVLINASGDKRIDSLVLKPAKNRNILYNSVDNPEACNFYVPAVIKNKDLVISISTGGSAPFMASYIKRELSKLVDPRWILAIREIAKKRKKLKASSLDQKEKNIIYRNSIKNTNFVPRIIRKNVISIENM